MCEAHPSITRYIIQASTFDLPDYTSGLSYTIHAYITDTYGGTSSVFSASVTTGDLETVVANREDGQTTAGTVHLTWHLDSDPGTLYDADVAPGEYFAFAGTTSDLTATLLSDGTYFDLQTNGTFHQVQATSGLSGVTLTLNTTVLDASEPDLSDMSPALLSDVITSAPAFYGNGDIGEVDLPGGGSTLAVYAHGNLGSIVGPSPSSVTGAAATDLYFANLTGSITGLDSINALVASGWLGSSESQQVVVNSGIQTLNAYGIGAQVIADANYNLSDPGTTATVGAGGVPGILDLGTLTDFTAGGAVNVVKMRLFDGPFDVPVPANVQLVMFNTAKLPADLEVGKDVEIVGTDVNKGELNSISAGKDIKMDLHSKGSLTVDKSIIAEGDIASLFATGDVTVNGGISSLGGNITLIDVQGNLKVTDNIMAKKEITKIHVGGNLTAHLITNIGDKDTPGGDIKLIDVGKDLTASVSTAQKLETLKVGGNLTKDVQAKTIDKIEVTGNIGVPTSKPIIQADSIGTVISTAGNVIAVGIIAKNGNISLISAAEGEISSTIQAYKGNIVKVTAATITGSIAATMTIIPAGLESPAHTVGGNIGTVTATKKIEHLGIWADRQIQMVQSQNSTAVEIHAQGGGNINTATGEATNVQALQVNVVTGNFLGVVFFEYNKAPSTPSAARIAFSDGTGLLTLTASNAPGGKTWTVKRVAGAAASVNLKLEVIGGLTGVISSLPAEDIAFTMPGTNTAPIDATPPSSWTIQGP